MKPAPWLLARIGELAAGETIVLDDAESRHAGGSLRLSPGDQVALADGAGRVAQGTLVLLRRNRAEVRVGSIRDLPRPAAGPNLAVGVLAGSAMDLVVQKAVELGVHQLIPVCCRRSQLGLQRAATRIDHWSRIGRQALKQCRRPWAMDIVLPVPLPELIVRIGPVGGLVADPDGQPPAAFDPSLHSTLLVGPEGGFDSDEEALLEEINWPHVRLGPHVLRAETAAIAGIAVISARIAEKSGVHSDDG
jgi:16S rRNA (uracil1498-N3)-methyltransferase